MNRFLVNIYINVMEEEKFLLYNYNGLDSKYQEIDDGTE